MAPIQKAIRDLERCIRKKKEKGESTELLDKKLLLLFDDKTISDQIQKEKRNSAKYHMIKFVERQKLVRKIRSIDTQLLVADADVSSLNKSRNDLMEQLAYVLYYPKEMKYIALFADTESIEITNKNEKLRIKAHAIAVKEWNSDKANGNQDRVMRVILGEEKEGKEGRDENGYDDDKNTSDNTNDNGGNESKSLKRKENRTDSVTYGSKTILPKNKKQKLDNNKNNKNGKEKEVVSKEEKEDEELINSFPEGQEPDPFFMEEEIISTKIAAKLSKNTVYPPENGNNNYNNNSNDYNNNNNNNNKGYNSNGTNFNNNKNFNAYKNSTYGPGNAGGYAVGAGGYANKNNFSDNRGGRKALYGNTSGGTTGGVGGTGGKKPAYGAGTFSSFAPTKQSARLQKWQSRKGH